MTLISVEEFRANLDAYLNATTQGEVVLTRDGKPIAVLRAIPPNGDEGARGFVGSAEFWHMIHERREEEGIPWEDARRQLDLGGP